MLFTLSNNGFRNAPEALELAPVCELITFSFVGVVVFVFISAVPIAARISEDCLVEIEFNAIQVVPRKHL